MADNRERPILFSGPMVLSILQGRKTQTRRVVKGTALDWLNDARFTPSYVADRANGLSRFGYPGDRLWVRETWCPANSDNGPVVLYKADQGRRYLVDESYPVDYSKFPVKGNAWSAWASEVEEGSTKANRPAIHMPRWACRLVLEITDVRIERLHDITEADARAEGAEVALAPDWYAERPGEMRFAQHRYGFADIWGNINGAESWNANPWVWVITFKPWEIQHG